MKQKITGPALYRAQVGVEVLDESQRRFRMSFSSDAPYTRDSYFADPWVEILGHSKGEVDLSRIDGGAAPLLWGHDPYARDSHIGIVERAWLEDGKGWADVRMSSRADLDSLWQDVQSGIVRNVSVGYKIHERVLTRANSDGPSEYRVTNWTPMELSLVSVPADPSVGVGRQDDGGPAQFVIEDLEKRMDIENQTPAPVAAVASVTETVDTNAIRAEASVNERTRIHAIRSACDSFSLPADFRESLIQSGKPLEACRAEIIDAATKHKAPAVGAGNIQAGKDEAEKRRDGMSAWLVYRSGYVNDVDLKGNEFRGMTLADLARDCVQRSGQDVRGMSRLQIAQIAMQRSSLIAHSTSDFSTVLENSMHKVLQAGYLAIPDTWRSFCAVGTLADFRPHYRYRMGSFGSLSSKTENGEYQHGTLSDADRESITGATKGKIITISREMIINDDLGAFVGLANSMGRAAARAVEADVYALLVSNPTTGDTGALFNSTAITTAGGHANLAGSGAAISVTTLEAARVAMASQMDVARNDYLDIRPSVLLCPIGKGGAAKVVIGALYDPDVSSKFQVPNIVNGLVQTIVDTPRLSGTAWYLFADPGVEPVIEVGFLDGNQQPYIEQEMNFNSDGMAVKVRYDYGVAAVGWRGAYKNAGA
jgi:hypothetical protein